MERTFYGNNAKSLPSPLPISSKPFLSTTPPPPHHDGIKVHIYCLFVYSRNKQFAFRGFSLNFVFLFSTKFISNLKCNNYAIRPIQKS